MRDTVREDPTPRPIFVLESKFVPVFGTCTSHILSDCSRRMVAVIGMEQIGERINVPGQLVGQITDQFEPTR